MALDESNDGAEWIETDAHVDDREQSSEEDEQSSEENEQSSEENEQSSEEDEQSSEEDEQNSEEDEQSSEEDEQSSEDDEQSSGDDEKSSHEDESGEDDESSEEEHDDDEHHNDSTASSENDSSSGASDEESSEEDSQDDEVREGSDSGEELEDPHESDASGNESDDTSEDDQNEYVEHNDSQISSEEDNSDSDGHSDGSDQSGESGVSTNMEHPMYYQTYSTTSAGSETDSGFVVVSDQESQSDDSSASSESEAEGEAAHTTRMADYDQLEQGGLTKRHRQQTNPAGSDLDSDSDDSSDSSSDHIHSPKRSFTRRIQNLGLMAKLGSLFGTLKEDLQTFQDLRQDLLTKKKKKSKRSVLCTPQRRSAAKRLVMTTCILFCIFIVCIASLTKSVLFGKYGMSKREEPLYDPIWTDPSASAEEILSLLHVYEHKITNDSTIQIKRLPGLDAPSYINKQPQELVQIRRPAVRKMRPEDSRAIRTFGCLRDGCRGLDIEDLLDRNWQMRFRAAQSGDTYKSINYRVTFLLTDTTQLNHMQKVRPDLYKSIYNDYEGKCYLTAFQGGDAIGGNKGQQLKVKESYTKKYGCKYNDLGISPMSYRLYLEDECQDIDRVQASGVTWLLKPETGSQGQGITFHETIEGVKSKVPQFFPCKADEWKPTERYLVQEYLERPLLLKKSKFDVRVYMLIASSNPYLVFYHEGYLRRALAEYSARSTDRRVYLTNTHFQSMKKGFKLSDHIWPFAMMQDHLREHDKTGAHYIETILNPYIKKVALFIFQSARQKFVKRKGTFHIFGIDFMLDANYHPWFIESNGYPGFTWSINFDSRNMVEEYFNLAQQVHENPAFYTQMRAGDRYGDFEMIFNELEEERTAIPYNPCQEFKNNRAFSAPLKVANQRFAKYTGKTGSLASFSNLENHIDGLENIGRNKAVSLRTQSNFFKAHECAQRSMKYMPATFNLEDPQDCEKFFSTESQAKWVVKPIDGRGENKLYKSADDVRNAFGSCDTSPESRRVIVQKFVEDRQLFGNKWWDMKVFMLVSTSSPYMVFYHRGYLRSSQIASVGTPRRVVVAPLAHSEAKEDLNKDDIGVENNESTSRLRGSNHDDDDDDKIDLGLDELIAERQVDKSKSEASDDSMPSVDNEMDSQNDDSDGAGDGDEDSLDMEPQEAEAEEENLEPWAPSEYNTGDQWVLNEHFMTFEEFQDSQAKANMIGSRYLDSVFDVFTKQVAEMVFRSGRFDMLSSGNNITRSNTTFQLFSLNFMIDSKYRIMLTNVRDVEDVEQAFPAHDAFTEDKEKFLSTLKGVTLETNDMPSAFARMRRGDSYANWRLIFSEMEEKQRKDVREYNPCTEFRRDMMITRGTILKNAWLHNYAEKRHAANKRELNKYIFQKWDSCKHRPTKEMQSSCVRNTISYRYKIYLAKEGLQYQDGYVEMRIKDLHARAAMSANGKDSGA